MVERQNSSFKKEIPYKKVTLCGGKVPLLQPLKGYVPGLDAVMLAAFFPKLAQGTALDLGCGSGAVMLCRKWFQGNTGSLLGMEYQMEMAALAQENIKLNQTQQAYIFCADVGQLPLQGHSVDHVMTNPPYFKAGSGSASPDLQKRVSFHGEKVGLPEWLQISCHILKPQGTLTCILKGDQLQEALANLPHMGGIQIFPLYPRAGEPAKRVLLSAKKGVRSPLIHLSGLVLHARDGEYTPQAKKILLGQENLSH